MAQEDKERWDEKWRNKPMPDEPIKLVSDYASLAPGLEALDIACGMGRHSRYLASKGFEVDALDISSVAIDQLQNIPHIHAKEVDFDTYTLPKEKYDLIICTYFLERRLFPQMIDALKPNGIILMETFLHHPDNERTTSNPAFLLNEGELEATFDETCELLQLPEFWDEDYQGYRTMKTSMVAKKKAAV
ncbi:methyltransferase domain-containing protein [Sulfurovum sp. XTW-4]|uniref:Methyltransferase domain-containing protein n=1 Tax=Sulfurovum xiamenensis TaxID=3019066 RepID=A0ABT7QVM8_9BACT|nr:methyltransferase domain-containing protein [Sulfurovum xiamenensis]MDM5264604.1 methyltransferase domain-containing protein [Sulfurovum xiamenensis]